MKQVLITGMLNLNRLLVTGLQLMCNNSHITLDGLQSISEL